MAVLGGSAMFLFTSKTILPKTFDFYGDLSKKAVLFVRGNLLPYSMAYIV